jgi:hypothetical protein
VYNAAISHCIHMHVYATIYFLVYIFIARSLDTLPGGMTSCESNVV